MSVVVVEKPSGCCVTSPDTYRSAPSVCKSGADDDLDDLEDLKLDIDDLKLDDHLDDCDLDSRNGLEPLLLSDLDPAGPSSSSAAPSTSSSRSAFASHLCAA